MDRSEHRHDPPTRRLQLPSGREIDVMVFADPVDGRHAPPARGLSRCRTCHSELVHPTRWEELADGGWRLELRCPNCHWRGTGVYRRAAVEELDGELERGMQAIVRDLRRLSQANMEDEVERFSRALRDGLILPMDF